MRLLCGIDGADLIFDQFVKIDFYERHLLPKGGITDLRQLYQVYRYGIVLYVIWYACI